MADYRRHDDERPRRHARDWSDRAAERVRSWFGERDRPERHSRSGNDERDDRFPYGGERNGGHEGWRSEPYPDTQRDDRASRWDGSRDDREQDYYAAQAFGSYRTDDRQYHDRYRPDRYRTEAPRDGNAAADEYFRAAREQRHELLQYEAQSPGAYVGRGPKGYRRSDERVCEEICDRMTEDPMLDASEISVQVSEGEVTLTGSVTSREQKRRAEDVAERVSGVNDVTNQLRVVREANGHLHTATRPVTQSEPGTPSKSSRTTT